MTEITFADVVKQDPDIVLILEAAGVSQETYLRVFRAKAQRIQKIADAIAAQKKAEYDQLVGIFDEQFRSSRFVVSFHGGNPAAFLAKSWQEAVDLVHTECGWTAEDWTEIQHEDAWTSDGWGRPCFGSSDIGETDRVEIARINAYRDCYAPGQKATAYAAAGSGDAARDGA